MKAYPDRYIDKKKAPADDLSLKRYNGKRSGSFYASEHYQTELASKIRCSSLDFSRYDKIGEYI